MEGVDKENNEVIMQRIKEAGDSENYETTWDENGIPQSKKRSEIKKGKSSRARGARFELRVRKDLEDSGSIVDKWTNNVDLENNKIIPAKRKFNPFSRVMSIGTGFPDFISIKKISEESYRVVGVEVKVNGILSKEEKEKCRWYLGRGIFSRIWIAKQGEKRGEILYEDFAEKYNKT